MTHSSEKKGSPVQGAPPTSDAFEQMSGKSSAERHAELGALVLAVGLHFWGGASAAANLFDLSQFAGSIRAEVIAQLEMTVDIDQPEPEDEKPEPEPEPEPEEEPEEEPEPLEPPDPTDPTEPTEEAPPAPAEAGKVLTQEPDPDEPLDLTGEGFISGTGTRFAGGITSSDGTSKTAVRNRNARPGGVQGARGKTDGAKGPPPVDKSRPARVDRNANWNSCGFPPEADAEQKNQARVRLVVVVSAAGKPTSVSVLSDPGYGFGPLARRCAMRKRYQTAQDKKGNPIAGATRPFTVTFVR